jgi:glycosyltransferase involved in cell wall biosynthesis
MTISNNIFKTETCDLTAIILTYNEEKHIERCINSVKHIAKRIIVIDSYSTDNTLNILKKNNIEFLQNKFINQSKQLDWGLENAKITTGWILRLDSDEILSNRLIKKISGNFSNYNSNISGISVNRELFFLGKNINFGGVFPHKTLRIWKNGKGKSDGSWVDEHIIVDGKVIHLEESIIDKNLNNLSWWINKHKSYALREAINFLLSTSSLTNYVSKLSNIELLKKRRKYTIYYKLPIIFRPLILFLYSYFFRLGFLNGWQGLVFHFLQGFWFRLLVDIKILEIRKLMKKNNLSLERVVKNRYNYII